MRSACIGAVCVLPLVQGDVSVRKVAEWTVNEVATVHIADNLPGVGKSLVGTTFGPFGKDNVYAIGPLSAKSDAPMTVLSDGFKWPNEAKVVPEEVKAKAGLDGYLMQVADGFLVPTIPSKSTGGIHLVKVGDGLDVEITKLTEDKSNWFYHHSEWADIDMDGILDLVAARSTSPIVFGSPDSELVWVKNNGNGTFGSTQVITKGPGVAFRLIDIDEDGTLEVVATEFFKNQQLAIYTCPEASWAECATKQNTVETVIASGEGPFFDLEWVDLNGDGKKDILCAAQQYTEGSLFHKKTIPGRVLAFEQPAAWTAGSSAAWTRHVISDGYLPQPKQPLGSGAPGAPSSFIKDTAVGGKPHVLLSSDDGGGVDILEPASQAPEDWTYNRHTIYTSQATTSQGVSTMGTPIAADVDGDGHADIIIPSYAENKMIWFALDSELSTVV